MLHKYIKESNTIHIDWITNEVTGKVKKLPKNGQNLSKILGPIQILRIMAKNVF